MIIHFIKMYLMVIFAWSISGTMLSGQSCKKKYKDKLEVSSKLIKCGGNYTVEKMGDGSYIFKRYYPENKQITHLATYTSDKYEVLHGLFEERYDDGTIVNQGMYKYNLKMGQWRENIHQVGLYNNGLRYGVWNTYNKDSMVIEVENYLEGKLNGERIKYDSMGTIVLTERYLMGDLIHTTADTSTYFEDKEPIFKGCEDPSLPKEDELNCTKNKLLEFVFQNLKYPEKSKNSNIQGDALVQFSIGIDGSVGDIKILNGVAPDIKIELISLVEKMPKWSPAIKNGKPVKVEYTLPFVFKYSR